MLRTSGKYNLWENITLLAVHRNVIFHDRPRSISIYIKIDWSESGNLLEKLNKWKHKKKTVVYLNNKEYAGWKCVSLSMCHCTLKYAEWNMVLHIVKYKICTGPYSGKCTRTDTWSATHSTVEPRYNEDPGTMKITFSYMYIRFLVISGWKKQRNYIKSWDQLNHLVIKRVLLSDLFIL